MTSSVDIEESVSSSKLSSTIGVAIFKSTELRRVCERKRKRRVDSSERERVGNKVACARGMACIHTDIYGPNKVNVDHIRLHQLGPFDRPMITQSGLV